MTLTHRGQTPTTTRFTHISWPKSVDCRREQAGTFGRVRLNVCARMASRNGNAVFCCIHGVVLPRAPPAIEMSLL